LGARTEVRYRPYSRNQRLANSTTAARWWSGGNSGTRRKANNQNSYGYHAWPDVESTVSQHDDDCETSIGASPARRATTLGPTVARNGDEAFPPVVGRKDRNVAVGREDSG